MIKKRLFLLALAFTMVFGICVYAADGDEGKYQAEHENRNIKHNGTSVNTAHSVPQISDYTGVLFNYTESGLWVQFEINVLERGTYDISYRSICSGNRGIMQLYIADKPTDGTDDDDANWIPQGEPMNNITSNNEAKEFYLGEKTFNSPGTKLFRFVTVSGGNYFALDYINVTSLGFFATLSEDEDISPRRGERIAIEFNSQPDSSTVIADNITLSNSSGGSIPVSVEEVGDGKFEVVFEGWLEYSKIYTLKLENITNTEGVLINPNRSELSFETCDQYLSVQVLEAKFLRDSTDITNTGLRAGTITASVRLRSMTEDGVEVTMLGVVGDGSSTAYESVLLGKSKATVPGDNGEIELTLELDVDSALQNPLIKLLFWNGLINSETMAESIVFAK